MIADSMETPEDDTPNMFQFTSRGSKSTPLCVDDEAMSDVHFDTQEEDHVIQGSQHNPIVIPVDNDDADAEKGVQLSTG